MFLFSIIFIGCGGSEVMLKPKYDGKEISTKKISQPNIKISKVVDRRTSDNKTVGTANVGMFNKTVPYHLSVPLNEFVQSIYDTLFLLRGDAAAIPAVIYIDTLEVGEYSTLFGEHGRMKAKMFFGVPLQSDSTIYITTRFDESVTSGIDVTNMLEPLLYKGIVDCGLQFAKKIDAMDVHPRANQDQQNATPESLSTTAILAPPPSNIENAIEATEPQSTPKSFSDGGIMYSKGSVVKSGVRLFYNMLLQNDSSKKMLGFGYNLEVLSIDNTKDGFKGTMVTFGGNIVYRRLFSDAPTSAYVGLQGTLTFGNETIDYGTRKETSFYFGPILRETIGVTFSQKVYIEAGLFEILLIGSKLLPSDIGFTAGISFGI